MMQTVKLTPEQTYQMQICRSALMASCPFFAHYFYSEMKEVPTLDIPTAATDGRHIFYNPEYLMSLKPNERVFVFAHEIFHVIMQHPRRGAAYRKEGEIRGKPYDQEFANICMDYVVNAGLIAEGVGLCNPAWCYDKEVTGGDLWEEVYEKKWEDKPPGQGQGMSGSYGGSGRGSKAAKDDPNASNGRFDEVLDPPVDPVTGRVDEPDPAEFREAIARAAAAAKAMSQGHLPALFQRLVDEVLEPQINWREHLRMLVTGKIGDRHETWAKLNRRRLVLNPMVIMPGRRGFGANNVAVVIDNSGSIGEKELAAFFGEVCGVMADCRPKNVILMWCDAKVQKYDEANSLDELAHLRVQGSPGGGGTSFIPPFEELRERGVVPETLIYITDMMGSFPSEAPSYPVIWCASTDIDAPWGEVVRIKV